MSSPQMQTNKTHKCTCKLERMIQYTHVYTSCVHVRKHCAPTENDSPHPEKLSQLKNIVTFVCC